MLEIVRGRTWAVVHSFFDDEPDGIPSDLSHIRKARCQIRSKSATRGEDGHFYHPIIAEPDVNIEANLVTLSLPRDSTNLLYIGDYVIDAVGTDANGNDEALLDPEPVRVVNRPTLPTGSVPPTIPDFVQTFETAIED
jgi:hypothetical protein